MGTSELVQKYGRPRPRTDTVVNIQYMLEVALSCAVGAFAGAGVRDGEPVPPEAADSLLELARWIAFFGSTASPQVIETPEIVRAPVYGLPLATVPRGNGGVAWRNDPKPFYRLWLVTHLWVSPLAPVIGSSLDNLPLVDNSGRVFMTECLSGFKLRAALTALVDLLADHLHEVIAEGEGNLWTWSDADEEHYTAWHPLRLMDAVRGMLRQLRESSSEGDAVLGETELPR